MIYSDFLLSSLILAILSSLVFWLMILSREIGVGKNSHLLTYFILPQGTFVITSAISGDIALALGMVGALSIVRFRNPVRSPVELAMYFILVGGGISAHANLWLTTYLIVVVLIFIIAYRFGLHAYLQRYFNRNSSEFSFGSNDMWIVQYEIGRNETIDVDFGSLIEQKIQDDKTEFKFEFSNEKEAVEFFNKINDNVLVSKASYRLIQQVDFDVH